MRFGITTFNTDRTIGIVELARAVEERGFGSLWLPEHTHIPVSRRSPYPVGGDLPDVYKRFVDPLVALTAAAIAAPTLRVGTGVLLLAQRDPIVTAKAAATLDLISGGRLTLGLGFGWNVDEMENHGVTYGSRRRRLREHALAMRRLWTDAEASFEGEFFVLAPSWSWPKPVQPNGPPLLLGGPASPKLFREIATYANGWLPIHGPSLTESIDQLREAFAAADRDPRSAKVTVIGVSPGSVDLDGLRAAGVDECVYLLPPGTPGEVLPVLDDLAAHRDG